MRQSLWREIWIIVGLLAASISVGAFTDHLFLAVVLGVSLYAAAHLRRLVQLHRWLRSDRRADLPDLGGLWGDVFHEARKLVRHSARRANELADALTRFQSAAAAMPDAVVIVSEKEEIEWANPSAASLLGIDYPRDRGLRLSNLLRDPEFTRYLHGADFSEPLETPSPTHPDLTLSLQIVPYSTQLKLVLARDITRLHRLEQTRRIFVSNVSHELRTPLTVLAGYIETLGEAAPSADEDLAKHFSTMHEQAARMQRLVDDLLTLSRLETAPRPKEEIVDVAALLASLKEQAQILSGEARHYITLSAQPELRLLGNREELHSAFMNLINNAVRHTPREGRIELRWFADEHGVKFSVLDTGEGIAAEHIPHLTERFYRVDSARSRATGGTGLGLSIVKHVLLRHDAQLDVRSELGRGSEFTCAFPPARVVRASAEEQTQRLAR